MKSTRSYVLRLGSAACLALAFVVGSSAFTPVTFAWCSQPGGAECKAQPTAVSPLSTIRLIALVGGVLLP